MNIIDQLAKRLSGHDDAEEPTPEELRAERIRRAPRNGPQRLRHVTNGQVKRQQVRTAKAQRRKANLRYRKSWKTAQRRQAILRGQLQVIGMLPSRVEPAPGLAYAVERALEEEFGSTDKAFEIYRELQRKSRSKG